MANNLFVSYDLIAPDKNYEAVTKAVKALGSWAKVHKSFWYVKSEFNAAQARDHLKKHIDANDKIIVINANDAAWNQLPDKVAEHIRSKWNQ